MSYATSTLIEADELRQLLQDNNLIVVDAGSRASYDTHHLSGALFADLNTQLAAIPLHAAEGGRHPLPAPEQFAATLGQLGISPTSRVVVYDDKNGSNAAARFWWMLRAFGHQQVQVLNGGVKAAEKAGLPIDATPVVPEPVPAYPTESWQLLQADMAEVEQVSTDLAYAVIDVRDRERYLGITEPIDTIAGHIPGALNIPFTGNLDPAGYFLPAETLQLNYAEIWKGRDATQVIVHCGSGVTACHTLLAMASAGYPIPKLYVGSWSEWSRNDKPIVTQKR